MHVTPLTYLGTGHTEMTIYVVAEDLFRLTYISYCFYKLQSI